MSDHEWKNTQSRTKQYSLLKILGIWAAAALPMAFLGWIVAPALGKNAGENAGFIRMGVFTVGLIWQFVLAMIILYREEGNLKLKTISQRFWLNHPVSPKSGETQKRLWWLIVPLILVTAANSMLLSPILDNLWVSIFPSLAEPPGFDFSSLLETPEMRAQFIGAWWLLGLFVLLSTFNTFLGEEFLFRGVLLPKMEGIFGKWDWVANGILFACYHLHQPWMILGGIVSGLLFAWSGKRYRTNWFPIILHSGQSVFFIFIILGLVLGLA